MDISLEKLCVILWIFIKGVWATSAQSCDNDALARCQTSSGISGYLQSIGQSVTTHYDVIIESEWLFKFNANQSQQFCGFWWHYDACLENDVVPTCDDVGKALFRSLRVATSKYCQTSHVQGDELHIWSCLQEDIVRKNLSTCHHDFVNDTTGQIIDEKEACSLRDKDVRGCIYRTLGKTCGRDAMVWIDDFFQSASKPIMDLYKCKEGMSLAPVTAIIVLFSLLSVTGLVVAVVCYCRGRAKSINQYRQLSDPMPSTTTLTVLDATSLENGREMYDISNSNRKQPLSNQIC